MTVTAKPCLPPLGLGLASVVLGAIGLLLFVLPVLAIPISASGLVLGVLGIAAACLWPAADLRLAVAGIGVCGMALGIAIAIDFAPGGYLRFPAEAPSMAPISERTHIAPPARFDMSEVLSLKCRSTATQ